MRITGGCAKGIQLKVPNGMGTRPATDSLREAIFSSLSGCVEGSYFLDLFAGTGAYGLESLSRGAVQGIFVEKDREAVLCLRENIERVCKSVRCETACCTLKQADVFKESKNMDYLPNIIFADPPYPYFENKKKLAGFIQVIADYVVQCERVHLVLELPADMENLEIPGLLFLKRLGKKSGKNAPSAAIYVSL